MVNKFDVVICCKSNACTMSTTNGQGYEEAVIMS